jgi:hypothetical protein
MITPAGVFTPSATRRGSIYTAAIPSTLEASAKELATPTPSVDKPTIISPLHTGDLGAKFAMVASPIKSLDRAVDASVEVRPYTGNSYEKLMGGIKGLIARSELTCNQVTAWAGFSGTNGRRDFESMTKPYYSNKKARWNNLLKNTPPEILDRLLDVVMGPAGS